MPGQAAVAAAAVAEEEAAAAVAEEAAAAVAVEAVDVVAVWAGRLARADSTSAVDRSRSEPSHPRQAWACPWPAERPAKGCHQR